MSLEDAIGSGPDFTADSVLDRVSRSILPELPENVSADAVLNRLNRKLSLAKPTAEEKPELASSGKTDKPDLSSYGTPIGDLPDLSSYGTPADAVPLPRPRPAGAPQPSIGVGGNLVAAAKGVPTGLAEGTGGVLQGAARLHNQAQPYLQSLQYDPEGNVIGQAPVQPAAPIEQHPLYQAGKTVKDLAPEMSPAERESIGGRLGTGVGSIAPYAAATAVNPLAGMAAGFTGMGLDTYNNVYEAAKAKGADDETASKAAGRSAIVAGVLGSVPLGAGALNKIPGVAEKLAGTAFDKWINSLAGKVVDSSAAFTTAGEAQEAILQQIAKDYDPKAGYTLDQKRLIAELILGAGMGGLHHAAEGRAAEQPAAEAPQPAAQARAPAEGLPPPGEEQPASAQSTGTPPPGPDTGASGPQGGPQPGPDTGGPGAAEQPRAQQAPPPGAEQPEPEQTRGAKTEDFSMDPKTRAKMEKVFRQFEPGTDPSKMSDADLFNALQEHLRDTSSTGYTAKPETAEEKTAREETAARRAEDEALRAAGWSEGHIRAMTPEQRRKYSQPAAKEEKPASASEEPVSKKQGEMSISPEAENIAAGTREAPIRPATADDVVRAQAAEPTPAQAEASNYRHAHVDLPQFGLTGRRNISIETGVGQARRGVGTDGKPWETTLEHGAYGRIKGVKGADGQDLDIFIGPHPTSPHIFVLNQHDPVTGKWDEHKILAGYRTPIDALHNYVNSFTDKAKGRIGGMVAMTPDQFKVWLDTADKTNPVEHESGQNIPWANREVTNGSKKERGSTRPSEHSGISDLGTNPVSMQQSEQPSSPQLRGTGNHDSSRMGRLPNISSARGAEANPEAYAGSDRQQQGIRSGERPLGNAAGAGTEYSQERLSDSERPNADNGSVGPRSGSQSRNDRETDSRGDVTRASGIREALGKKSADERLADKESGDEISSRRTSENGGPASRPRAERARPGEGEEAVPHGERVPDSGAEGSENKAETKRTTKVTGITLDAKRPLPSGIDQIYPEWKRLKARLDIGDITDAELNRLDVLNKRILGRANDDFEVIATNRDAIEKALGPDADRVSQVDIASAAEMMADHPDMDVAAAFGRAVIQNAVRQKFLTALEAAKAYGKEVETILGPEREGTSGSSPRAEESRAESGKERAGSASEVGKLSDSSKVSNPPVAAEVQNEPVADAAGKDTNAERNASREAAPAEAEREAAEGAAAKPEEPKPSVEKGAEGKPQLVIPGAEKAGQGDLAQRAANKPLKPKVAQKGMEVGLFGDEKNQTSLFEPEQKFGRGAEGQAYTLAQGRKTGNEHLVAYDANGNELGRTVGVAKHVGTSPEIEKAMLDPNGDIVVHHNHPTGSTLSAQDIAMLGLPGLRAVWAHGHTGNIFRAELTPEAKIALQGDPWTRARKLQAVQREINNEIFPVIQSAVDWNGLSIEDAHYGLHKLRNEILRDAGIIDYRTNDPLAGDFISSIRGLHVAVRSAIRSAQKQVLNEQRANRPADRRSEPLRHPGDLGATFDRGKLAAPVADARRSSPPDKAVNRPEEAPRREDKGVGGTQPRLLENETGFAQPDNTFKKEKSFDTSIGDILRKRLLGRLSDLNLTEARVQLQDKFLRVKKAEEAKGNTNSDLSAYQAESLYYGRTGHRLEQLRDNHIDPIIRQMKGRDIDLEQMDKFLYARHAPERNASVGKMYPPGHEFNAALRDTSKVGGSGMSTDDALKIIREIKAKGKLADYIAVAKMIDALNYKTRRTLFDSGLIDRATFDSMNNAYKYYVPLRGWAEGSEDEASLGSKGSGNDIRGDETKQAFGRKSEAASPLAYSLMQAELAIVRAEKNKVGNTFLRFVRSNPDPALWTIDRPDQRKSVSKVTGLVTSIDNGLSYQADNVFATKVDGKTVHITLKGPDGLNVARGLKNMGTAQVHAAIRMIASVTHAMAKLATSWNPNFMIPNLVRDLGEAFINLQAQQQKRFVRAFAGHIIPAIRGSMMAIAGKQPIPGDKSAKYIEAFHRYDREGGRIHFFGIEDPDKIEGNVNAKLKRLDGGIINGVKDLGEKAGKAFEIMGGGIENATRLAAFMAAEDAGLSTPDAAMLARNLTVDFNKKGELGSVISSLYMFSNAGAQGTARMLRALGHKRVWAAVGALAAASALATLYDIGMGGQDEAGTSTYMKIPPWEREKNIIVMLRDGSYAKLPMPYGFAPFAVVGSQTVATLMGKQTPGAAAMAILKSVFSAFNPLGEEDSWSMSFVPSPLRPAFHIAFNKDWTGKPLYPDGEHAKGMPASGQSFRTNSAFSKEAAKDLNQATGGNDYAPGLIDVHPGAIDHMMSAITGGVGKFVKDIADTIMTGATDHEWQPEKTPILRRFVGKVGADADRFAYYEARDAEKKLEGPVAAAKKDRKAGINEDEANKFLEENQTPQKRIFAHADKQMSRLRKDEAAATNSAIPYEEKKARLDAIRQEMRDVQNHARAESAKLKELVH